MTPELQKKVDAGLHLLQAAEWLVMSLYCNSVADFKRRFKNDNLFHQHINCKQFLETEFSINL